MKTYTFTAEELVKFVGQVTEGANLALVEAIKADYTDGANGRVIVYSDQLDELADLNVTPHDAQGAIDNLLSGVDDEKPTPPEKWETATLFDFCKDYELINENAEFEDWKNMRDELLRMTKEHIENED